MMFDRSVAIKTIARDHGVGMGQAAQMLPPKYWIAKIANLNGISESTVKNVQRVVDSIPLERMPFGVLEAA